MAITNRRRNYILAVKDDEGAWKDSFIEIGEFLKHKFIQHFATYKPTPPIHFTICFKFVSMIVRMNY